MRQHTHSLRASIWIIALLWMGVGWAEEAPPLKKGVLVLPFQAGEGLAEDQASIGIAVQNVIENMLTLHSDLDECWMNWHLTEIFPREEDFHTYVRGNGDIPTGVQALGFRYLLTGKVHKRAEHLVAAVEFRDRTGSNTHTRDVAVDLPTLQGFRRGVLALLEEVGIPVPAGQHNKVLWTEELPLLAFVLLGQGIEEFSASNGYHEDQGQWNSKPFEEGLTIAPQSYLLLNSLGRVLLTQKNYPQARRQFEQALALNPTGVTAASGLLEVGMELDDERLTEHWTKRIAEIQGRDVNLALIDLWIGRGLAARDQGEMQKAIQYFEQALAISRALGNRASESGMLANLGGTYYYLRQHAKAIEYYEQALAISRAMGNRRGEGGMLGDLGRVYESLSQYAKAIEYFERALGIQRAVGDRRGEGATLGNLGGAYNALSQYAKAIEYQEQALQIHLAERNPQLAGTTLTRLGIVYNFLGQHAKAIEYFERALGIQQAIGDRRGEGATLGNLGGAYNALSQYAKAIECHEKALVILRAIGNRAGEGGTLGNLGAVYGSLSQHAKAIEYFEKALAIQREVGDRAGEGTSLNNLGATYDSLSQYAKAIEYYEQALGIQRAIGDRAGEGLTLTNLMWVQHIQGQPQSAIFYGKHAVNVYQAIRSELRGLTQDLQKNYLTTKKDTYRYLADLLITAGRFPEAQQVLSLLKEEEFFDFIRRDAQQASSLQGRATLTPEEAKAERRYNEIADRIMALGSERAKLTAKQTRTPQEDERLTQLDADLEVANSKFRDVLAALETDLQNSPKGMMRVEQIKDAEALKGVLRALGSGTVALYTVVTEERYAVIVITPDVQVAREYKIPAAEFNQKVFAFKRALQNPQIDPRPLAQELYKILVAPIANDLDGAKAQTLMWSLDGVLRYVPLAALHDGERYLIERYRNVVFTPASNANLNTQPTAQWTGVGLGVSRQHEGFEALPAVPAELNGIIKDRSRSESDGSVPGTVLLDEAFTSATMRQALRKPPPVVHIASHFQFRPGNETESFLLLGDGSHLSLAQMNTWTERFDGVDVLTLSACDTATGGAGVNGKEIEGFGVLAQRKGAKAVVATLWPVADDSTRTLMQDFYRLRQDKKGISKAEALQQAQLALLHGQTEETSPTRTRSASAAVPEGVTQQPDTDKIAPTFTPNPKAPYAHPYYWAPFILIGNWL